MSVEAVASTFRRFIKLNGDPACGDDTLIIEATKAQYLSWHRERMVSERNAALGKQFQILSLDSLMEANGGFQRMIDVLADVVDVELLVEESDSPVWQELLSDLRGELASWRPWANDLLTFYLEGKPHGCTRDMAEKYGVSVQTIRKYKQQFESFVKKFLLGQHRTKKVQSAEK